MTTATVIEMTSQIRLAIMNKFSTNQIAENTYLAEMAELANYEAQLLNAAIAK
jgi:hypothetical protein